MKINTKIVVDKITDYIPVVSTVKSLFYLFEHSCQKKNYTADLKNTTVTKLNRMLLLIIPGIGNIAVICLDLFNKIKTMKSPSPVTLITLNPQPHNPRPSPATPSEEIDPPKKEKIQLEEEQEEGEEAEEEIKEGEEAVNKKEDGQPEQDPVVIKALADNGVTDISGLLSKFKIERDGDRFKIERRISEDTVYRNWLRVTDIADLIGIDKVILSCPLELIRQSLEQDKLCIIFNNRNLVMQSQDGTLELVPLQDKNIQQRLAEFLEAEAQKQRKCKEAIASLIELGGLQRGSTASSKDKFSFYTSNNMAFVSYPLPSGPYEFSLTLVQTVDFVRGIQRVLSLLPAEQIVKPERMSVEARAHRPCVAFSFTRPPHFTSPVPSIMLQPIEGKKEEVVLNITNPYLEGELNHFKTTQAKIQDWIQSLENLGGTFSRTVLPAGKKFRFHMQSDDGISTVHYKISEQCEMTFTWANAQTVQYLTKVQKIIRAHGDKIMWVKELGAQTGAGKNCVAFTNEGIMLKNLRGQSLMLSFSEEGLENKINDFFDPKIKSTGKYHLSDYPFDISMLDLSPNSPKLKSETIEKLMGELTLLDRRNKVAFDGKHTVLQKLILCYEGKHPLSLSEGSRKELSRCIHHILGHIQQTKEKSSKDAESIAVQLLKVVSVCDAGIVSRVNELFSGVFSAPQGVRASCMELLRQQCDRSVLAVLERIKKEEYLKIGQGDVRVVGVDVHLKNAFIRKYGYRFGYNFLEVEAAKNDVFIPRDYSLPPGVLSAVEGDIQKNLSHLVKELMDIFNGPDWGNVDSMTLFTQWREKTPVPASFGFYVEGGGSDKDARFKELEEGELKESIEGCQHLFVSEKEVWTILDTLQLVTDKEPIVQEFMCGQYLNGQDLTESRVVHESTPLLEKGSVVFVYQSEPDRLGRYYRCATIADHENDTYFVSFGDSKKIPVTLEELRVPPIAKLAPPVTVTLGQYLARDIDLEKISDRVESLGSVDAGEIVLVLRSKDGSNKSPGKGEDKYASQYWSYAKVLKKGKFEDPSGQYPLYRGKGYVQVQLDNHLDYRGEPASTKNLFEATQLRKLLQSVVLTRPEG